MASLRVSSAVGGSIGCKARNIATKEVGTQTEQLSTSNLKQVGAYTLSLQYIFYKDNEKVLCTIGY